MKPLFTLTLMALSLMAISQNKKIDGADPSDFFKHGGKDTAVRRIRYEQDSFKIVYAYGDDGFDDLVGVMITDKNGKYDAAATDKYRKEHNEHHYANIFVYKLDKHGKIIKSYPMFEGVYVIAGCYEDVPVEEVKKAIAIDDPRKDVYKLWCVHHKYGMYWLNDSDYMFHGKRFDMIGSVGGFGTGGRFSDEVLKKNNWKLVDNSVTDGGMINIMEYADEHNPKSKKKLEKSL